MTREQCERIREILLGEIMIEAWNRNLEVEDEDLERLATAGLGRALLVTDAREEEKFEDLARELIDKVCLLI